MVVPEHPSLSCMLTPRPSPPGQLLLRGLIGEANNVPDSHLASGVRPPGFKSQL